MTRKTSPCSIGARVRSQYRSVKVPSRVFPREREGQVLPFATRGTRGSGLAFCNKRASGAAPPSHADNNRRLTTWETPYSAVGTFAFNYGIDIHGHVSSMAYPGGPTVLYSPSALGQPTQMSGYLAGISHHPNGQVAGYTTTNGVTPGLTHTVTQNVRGLPAFMGYGSLVQDSYSYDANGNVTAITGANGLASRAMAYDGLDRLRVANGIWGSGQFTYDALDNLTSSLITGGSTPRQLNHLYDPSTNRMTGVSGTFNVSLLYDANGNIVNRAGQGYVFDIGNRITSATGLASYLYDGHGRRAWIQFTNGRTVLSIYGQSGRLLLTQDSQRGTTRHIHLGDKVVAETNTLTGTQWLHTDVLGSPVATTGTGGVLLTRSHYEPYGQSAGGTNRDGIGYTGHVNDVATGLVYVQQRYYDPIAGRFLSVDPVVTDAKTGSNFNRYEYAGNNPYKYVDPDGRAKFAAVVMLLENGGDKIVRTLRDKADAVAARLAGENVITATSQHARQVEVAAHGAGNGLLKHKGHKLEDGSKGMPHYQTDGKPGHTFWGQRGGILPELLEALTIPALLTPSSLAPGTLYGPGTSFPTREAFDNANGPSASSAVGAGKGSGFQGAMSRGLLDA
jgi:RHS repeat-associated protein